MSTAIVMPSTNVSRFFGTDLSNLLKDKNSKNVTVRQDLIQKKSKMVVEKPVTQRKASPLCTLFIANEAKQGTEEINGNQLIEEFCPQIENSMEQMVQKLIADDETSTPTKSILKYDRDFMLRFKDVNVMPRGMVLIPEITRMPGSDEPIPVQQIWIPKPQIETNVKKATAKPKEDDPHRLQQREKQIEFGKNTDGYKRYREITAKKKRTREEPQTPDKHQKCSKRSWDGQIRKWRRLLHKYDPNAKEGDCDIDVNEDINEIEEMEVVGVLQELNLKINAVESEYMEMIDISL